MENQAPMERLAEAVRAALVRAMAPGAETLARAGRLAGSDHPIDLAAILCDEDNPEHSSLWQILVFPGAAEAESVEAVLIGGSIPQAAEDSLAGCLSRPALFPGAGGGAAACPPPWVLDLFVRRLRLTAKLPAGLVQAAAQLFPGPECVPFLAALRRCRVAFTEKIEAACRALLESLAARPPEGADLWPFALRVLEEVPAGRDPAAYLSARREDLCRELARAAESQRRLSGVNRETAAALGIRPPYADLRRLGRDLALMNVLLSRLYGAPALFPEEAPSAETLLFPSEILERP